MSWLLKIVDGPMKGAEIALVDGMKVRVGSGDACDIVVADGALPEVAFDLDAAEAAVTLLTPAGDARVLRPFEAASFGTSAFVVGPADGPWQEIVWPKPEPPAEEPVPAAEPAPEPAEEPAGETPPATGEEKDPAPRRRRGCGCGCLVAVLLLVLLAAALALLCRVYPEQSGPYVERGRAYAEKAWGWTTRTWAACRSRFASGDARADAAALPPPDLGKIAAEHGLALEDADGVAPLLKGNVARRTERLAIRALALAAKPSVRFDLTDDETLLRASDELLFVVTEGALKATSASNRVVTLTGYAPNAAKLEQAVRALNADVPGIDRLLTADVVVGGKPPKSVEKTAFVASARPAPENVPAPAVPAGAKRDFPIAGILTVPYPCVVMRNGLRLAEGAQVGTAVIEKIESDRLVLRDGRTTFEWRP